MCPSGRTNHSYKVKHSERKHGALIVIWPGGDYDSASQGTSLIYPQWPSITFWSIHYHHSVSFFNGFDARSSVIGTFQGTLSIQPGPIFACTERPNKCLLCSSNQQLSGAALMVYVWHHYCVMGCSNVSSLMSEITGTKQVELCHRRFLRHFLLKINFQSDYLCQPKKANRSHYGKCVFNHDIG